MADSFRWKRALAIAEKEVFHIRRDRFTLAIALLLPLVVVLIFGIAINFNLDHIPTAVLDQDHSASSRQLVNQFGSSDFFQMMSTESPQNGLSLIESEKARALMVIPAQFEKDLLSNRGSKVQILVDAADNSAASSILGYLGEMQVRSNSSLLGVNFTAPVQLRTRFLFNPELNSKWFIVPGLVVVIMALLSVLLTALTVAREWESGSMELLLSTPVHPTEVIIGKLMPYAALCLFAVGMVYLLARLLFHVPFTGSHFVFLSGSLIFLATYLAQGLLISVLTRRQMLAMQFALLSGFLPSQLLSGFIFPIESMPRFFQYFTMIFPARWFMVIARDSFLQGSSFWDLRVPFFALTLSCLIFIFLAVKKFKKDVEP